MSGADLVIRHYCQLYSNVCEYTSPMNVFKNARYYYKICLLMK